MKLDLNCDLGEEEAPSLSRRLTRRVSSINVACGGHAGNRATMERCVRWAKLCRVRLGAHPGPWNRSDFGRRPLRLAPDELELLLLQQVSALQSIARLHRMRLHHIKLHGALYHATEADPSLARRYLQTVARFWPRAVIYALAGGKVASIAHRFHVSVWEEAFADRAYDDHGRLVPRSSKHALITSPDAAAARVQCLLLQGGLPSLSGRLLKLKPQTLCFHSDTPHALQLASRLQNLLR